MPLVATFDFDQTLCDTSSLEGFRRGRDWARCRARGATLPFYAGIRDALLELHRTGAAVGVASTSPGDAYLAPFLRRLHVPFDFVLDYFAARDLSGPVTRPGRSSMKALQLSEVRRRYPGRAVVFVGDDPDDAEAARLADVAFLHACFGGACESVIGEHVAEVGQLVRSIQRLGKAA